MSVPSAANVYLARQARSSGHDDGSGNVTRCPCTNNRDSDGFMIACETCGVWQHGSCVGVDDKTVPDQYYCELCMPEHPIHVEKNGQLRPPASANNNNQNTQNKKTAKQKGDGSEKAAKRKRAKKEEGEGADELANEDAENKRVKSESAPSPTMNGATGEEAAEAAERAASREERKLKKLLETIKKLEDRETKKAKRPSETAQSPGQQTRQYGEFATADGEGNKDDDDGPEYSLPPTAAPPSTTVGSVSLPLSSSAGESFHVELSSIDPTAPAAFPPAAFPTAPAEPADASPPPPVIVAPTAASPPSHLRSASPNPSPGPGRPPKVKRVNNNTEPAQPAAVESVAPQPDQVEGPRATTGCSFNYRRQMWRSRRLITPIAPMYFGVKQLILDQWALYKHQLDNFGWTKQAQQAETALTKKLVINRAEQREQAKFEPFIKRADIEAADPSVEIIRYKPPPPPVKAEPVKSEPVIAVKSEAAPMEDAAAVSVKRESADAASAPMDLASDEPTAPAVAEAAAPAPQEESKSEPVPAASPVANADDKSPAPASVPAPVPVSPLPAVSSSPSPPLVDDSKEQLPHSAEAPEPAGQQAQEKAKEHQTIVNNQTQEIVTEGGAHAANGEAN